MTEIDEEELDETSGNEEEEFAEDSDFIKSD